MEHIDYCEWCGRLDHHLVAGECASCRDATAPYPADVALGAEGWVTPPEECPRAFRDED